MRDRKQLDNATQIEGEITFLDALVFLKEGWVWFMGGLVIGLIGAVGLLFILPTLYEATAVVQPARVGISLGGAESAKGVEVEPVTQTLERLKLATFYSQEVVQECQVPSALALAGVVKAVPLNGGLLIQLSYRARSSALAEVCLNSIIAKLAKSQADIAEPLLNRLQERLVLTRKQLIEAEVFQSNLEKKALSSVDSSAQIMQKALLERKGVVSLEKLLVEQRMLLLPPLTQPMMLLEPISAPDIPVSPKKSPVLARGILVGFALGGFLFFVRRKWLVHPV